MTQQTSDPYAATRLKKDEMFVDFNARIRNWQYVAIIAVVANVILSTGIILVAQNAKAVPYVVKTDDLGRAMAVGPAQEIKVTDAKVIEAFFNEYIEDARTIVADADLIRKGMDRVYQATIPSVRDNFLTKYYLANDPFEYAKKTGTRHVEVLSCLQQAENTYSIEWRETERDYDSQVLSESQYKALISMIRIPKTTKDQFRDEPWNPFGFRVTSISWAKI
ncbi:MAG: type IV secretion system protein [Candidatus Omnitrophota bacterium]